MKWTQERVIPWCTDPRAHPRIMHHHIMRYAWATRFVAGKRVVDLGCGTGYGSFMLSWVADSVLGVDVSAEAVAWARETFFANSLRFVQGDITKRIPDGDLYVAFEVLEHLDAPLSVLPGINAPLVWSMPVENGGRFHPHTYSIQAIRRMVGGACAYQTHAGEISTHIPNDARSGYVLGYKPGGA